jgi:outer membrane protein assembly factor BamE (lipoprotein component of BamABCDE complex)
MGIMYDRALIPLLLCISLWSGGCVMVPVPTSEDKILTGKQVTEEQLVFLTAGVTTKQEILERLGNPRVIWEDARVYVYNWQMRQGILFWAWGAYYTGGFGMTDIPRHYLLLIQFDEQDRVQRVDRTVCPLHRSYADCLREWEKGSDSATPRNKPDTTE